MFLLTSVLSFTILFTFTACDNDDNQIADRDWELTWEDEFDGPKGQLPDASKWQFDVGTGWGNHQLEYDTDRPENVSLDGNGYLAITAKKESYAGSAFTSGRIKTHGLFEQAYGRFEASIKLPYGPGLWPAFWLLGANVETDTWPLCGEIDIMEYRGQQPNLVYGSLHGPGYSGGSPISKSYGLENDRFDKGFHIYAVEWGEDFMHFYVDEILYQVVTPEDVPGEWVYDHPFFIILNLAVGGDYVGFPTSATPFPQTMLIDYVKVYKEK